MFSFSWVFYIHMENSEARLVFKTMVYFETDDEDQNYFLLDSYCHLN